VKRNSWWIAVAAGAAVALAASCTPTTECDYIDREVADPLHPTEDDVAYCWQGFDQFGLYAFRFERAQPGFNSILFVEYPPNALEPAGAERFSQWSVDPDFETPAGPVAVLEMPDLLELPRAQVQINSTSMILSTPSGASALRRAVCRGFGFETAEKQCRGSATRP